MFIPNPQPGFLPDSLKGEFVTPEQLRCMDCLRVNISKLIHPQAALKVGFVEYRAWVQLCQMASQGMCHVITWQLPHLIGTRGQVFAVAMSSPDITTVNSCLAAYSPHLVLGLNSVLLQGLTFLALYKVLFCLIVPLRACTLPCLLPAFNYAFICLINKCPSKLLLQTDSQVFPGSGV